MDEMYFGNEVCPTALCQIFHRSPTCLCDSKHVLVDLWLLSWMLASNKEICCASLLPVQGYSQSFLQTLSLTINCFTYYGSKADLELQDRPGLLPFFVVWQLANLVCQQLVVSLVCGASEPPLSPSIPQDSHFTILFLIYSSIWQAAEK